MHMYLATPLVGILPKPSVTKAFKLKVSALIILYRIPASSMITGIINPLSLDFTCHGIIIQDYFSIEYHVLVFQALLELVAENHQAGFNDDFTIRGIIKS